MSAPPCRVTVHSHGASTDLTLPATMPVAELIPAIVDILGGAASAPHRLSRLGCAPLPSSTTLAQNGIRDGTVLVLSEHGPQPPSRRCDDDAEAVAASLKPATETLSTSRISGALAAITLTATGALIVVRNAFSVQTDRSTTILVAGAAGVTTLMAAAFSQRILRDPLAGLTLAILATIFAALAGLLAVPGVPGAPGVLLAAMAAAVTAVLAIRLTHCGPTTLTALTCFSFTVAAAAAAGVVTDAPLHVVATMTTLTCLGLIEAAPRISMVLAGLSPTRMRSGEELAARTLRAEGWLTSLRGAFAAVAALGATGAAFSAHRAIPLAAVAGGILLLHARTDTGRTLVFTAGGVITITATFAIAGTAAPGYQPWTAALTATLAGTAIYLGFLAPTLTLSPGARRGVDALGCVASAAVVPLACWTCGAFGAVRGLSLHP